MQTVMQSAEIRVYKKRELGEWLLLPTTIRKGTGFRVTYGDFVRLTDEQMLTSGLDLFQKFFDAFGKHPGEEKSALEQFSVKQRQSFHRAHLLIIVFLDKKTGQLEINPIQGLRGGSGVSILEHRQICNWPLKSNKQLFDQLTEAAKHAQ